MATPQTEVSVVQSGTVQVFDHYESNGPMWTGEGDREVREKVTFDRSFQQAPKVFVSMTMADAESSTNLRYDLRVENVSGSDFEIIFRTWNDSRWARVRVNWIAIGSTIRDEYWVDF